MNYPELNFVVTATDPDGKSVFAHDGPADTFRVAMMPGFEFFRLWGTEGIPQLPADGTIPPFTKYFPEAGGIRLAATSFPPDATLADAEPPADLEAGVAEVNAMLPGLLDDYDPEAHGFHQTETIDISVCLSGEIYLELDDGAEAHVTPGTCVVQNGTRHAWHNRGSEPCLMLWFFIGAEARSPAG